MSWTDERVELLQKLWAEGLSASQIAGQLGGVSRNAVIGKVHRMKLSGRGRATTAPARQKKATASAAPAARPATRAAASPARAAASVAPTTLQAQPDAKPVLRQDNRPVDDVVVPISRRLDLTELTEQTCKWPNGDPLSDDFSFCGNQAGESGPYCAYHARLAFQPASERRRAR
ncbi:GcrA family cell cycle regulator [Aquamicrobium segne]|uniref:GcrA family cell cycle regulator n=1 Tax=Aquamicrobium segne TaxID=469547 RepID=A0ABW0H2J6_9HYPH